MKIDINFTEEKVKKAYKELHDTKNRIMKSIKKRHKVLNDELNKLKETIGEDNKSSQDNDAIIKDIYDMLNNIRNISNTSFLRCESVANPKHNSDDKKYNNDDKFDKFASFKNSWPICKSIMDQAIIIDDSLNNEQGKEAIKRAASKLIEELRLII